MTNEVPNGSPNGSPSRGELMRRLDRFEQAFETANTQLIESLREHRTEVLAEVAKIEATLQSIVSQGLPLRVERLESNWTWLVRSVLLLVIAAVVGGAIGLTT